MFDADRITRDVIQQMSGYLGRFLRTLFPTGELPPALSETDWQALLDRPNALSNDIRRLVRVANGDIPADQADDLFMEDVQDSIRSVCKTLFAAPGSPHAYEIPPLFWGTELGRVVRHCQLWLRGDDLITYTEAAEILFPDADLQIARMRIKRMVERGELTAYIDPRENNPQHAARVSRQEVEESLAS